MTSKQTAPGNCSRALFSFRPSGRQAGPTVVIGHLIPAGTGIYRYHDIEIEPPEGFTPPTPPVEAALPGVTPAPSPFPEEVEAE
jgi:hypothetical protein